MPEQVELRDAVEPGETGEAAVGERTIDQQVSDLVVVAFHERRRWRSIPDAEPRKLVQERQPFVCDQPAGAEAAQLRLAGERTDGAVAGRRSHEVHDFETIAEAQVLRALVGDTALPRHLEMAKVRKMAEHFQAAIGEAAAGIRAEIEPLQLRHACQVVQPLVCELPGAAERQRRHVIERRNPRQDVVGHQPAGIEGGDATLVHRGEQPVPLSIGEGPLRVDAVLLRIDREGRQRARARAYRVTERIPAAESRILRENQPGLLERQVVGRHPGRSLAEGVVAAPDLAPQVVESELAFVVAVEPGQRARVSPEGEHVILRKRVVRFHVEQWPLYWRLSRFGAAADRALQRDPVFLSVLPCESVLHVAQHRLAWRLRPRAVEAGARAGIAGAKRSKPAFRFFPEILERGAGRDLARHADLPSVVPGVRLIRAGRRFVLVIRTRVGGSRLPCRGQEAPQRALKKV